MKKPFLTRLTLNLKGTKIKAQWISPLRTFQNFMHEHRLINLN